MQNTKTNPGVISPLPDNKVYATPESQADADAIVWKNHLKDIAMGTFQFTGMVPTPPRDPEVLAAETAQPGGLAFTQNTPLFNGKSLSDLGQDTFNNALLSGYKYFGNSKAPAATLGQTIYNEENNYPEVFNKYPFLISAIINSETSGGNNVAYPNNITNYGIGLPKNVYDPKSFEHSIKVTTKAIADPNNDRNYAQFRKTGDLIDLSDKYSPLGNNITSQYGATGGPYKALILQQIMNVFNQQAGLPVDTENEKRIQGYIGDLEAAGFDPKKAPQSKAEIDQINQFYKDFKKKHDNVDI